MTWNEARDHLQKMWVETWGDLTVKDLNTVLENVLREKGMKELEIAKYVGGSIGRIFKAREHLMELLMNEEI